MDADEFNTAGGGHVSVEPRMFLAEGSDACHRHFEQRSHAAL
jgi:hypothetical protein